MRLMKHFVAGFHVERKSLAGQIAGEAIDILIPRSFALGSVHDGYGQSPAVEASRHVITLPQNPAGAFPLPVRNAAGPFAAPDGGAAFCRAVVSSFT